MVLAIAENKAELQSALRLIREAGRRIAFVPTMGALHEGHISLINVAKTQADVVVASIFVNPLQFGPNEDFSRYPRTLQADKAMLEQAGCDFLYTPTPHDMYPEGFSTGVTVHGVSEGACGGKRPGHFDGVATVVAKLLLRVQPDIAVFGEKDYQQLAVIRRMVTDLDVPVSVIGAPTLREADGLAMSSRNRYLTEEERKIAPAMYTILKNAAARINAQPSAVAAVLEDAQNQLTEAGFTQVDYLELRDVQSWQPVAKHEKPARLLAAAWLGKTRLIDNILV